MNYTEQEIATMVAQKCQEVLAPFYAELEELQAHYGLRKAEQPTEPTPTQEEIEDAEFKKNIQEMKQMLIKSGRIKA
jgi:hypothetical protein